MLTSAKFRSDIRSNCLVEEEVSTKLSLALTSVARAHEKWYDGRATAERHKASSNSVKAPGTGIPEEDKEESKIRKNLLRLSSFFTFMSCGNKARDSISSDTGTAAPSSVIHMEISKSSPLYHDAIDQIVRAAKKQRGPNNELPSSPRTSTLDTRASPIEPPSHDQHRSFRTKQTQTGTTFKRGLPSRPPPGLPMARLPLPGLSKVTALIHNGRSSSKKLKVDLLLDCGCATNVLNYDSALEAQLDIMKADNVTLLDAAGTPMAVAGQSLVKVELPTRLI
jgi:hypothetical protein